MVFIPFGAKAQNKFAKQAEDAYLNYQYQSAIDLYKKALSEMKNNDPDRGRLTYRLAKSYMKTGNWKAAAVHFSRLEKGKFFESNSDAILDAARTYQLLGDQTAAIDYYKRYLHLHPEDSLISLRMDMLEGIRDALYPIHYNIEQLPSINSNKDDFSLSFANAEETDVVFTSNRKGVTGKDVDQWTSASFTDIFSASLKPDGSFTTPVLFEGKSDINTSANEGTAVFSNNFHTFLFTRCVHKVSKKPDDLWCSVMGAQRSGDNWSEPVAVFNDPNGNAGHPTVSNNGLLMIYSSSNQQGIGGKDLWMATRLSISEAFSGALHLGGVLNSPGDEMFPYLRNDSTLYFASNGHGGYGGLDIYVSHRQQDGSWGSPINMGKPVNSGSDDFALVFSKVSEAGFFTSNRPGGKGGDDLYRFFEVKTFFDIAGIIVDDVTNQQLPNAEVSLVLNDDRVGTIITDDGTFRFEKNLSANKNNYVVVADVQGYLSGREHVTQPSGSNVVEKTIRLQPLPKSAVILPEIFYDLDSWALLPQYQDSLSGLIDLLTNNPSIVIELSAHTDARADDAYNQDLSQKRAQSVVNFLISKGIKPERLMARGYGEQKPRKLEKDIAFDGFVIPSGTVLDSKYILSLEDEAIRERAHQLNRRTEFKIVVE